MKTRSHYLVCLFFLMYNSLTFHGISYASEPNTLTRPSISSWEYDPSQLAISFNKARQCMLRNCSFEEISVLLKEINGKVFSSLDNNISSQAFTHKVSPTTTTPIPLAPKKNEEHKKYSLSEQKKVKIPTSLQKQRSYFRSNRFFQSYKNSE